MRFEFGARLAAPQERRPPDAFLQLKSNEKLSFAQADYQTSGGRQVKMSTGRRHAILDGWSG